jgi:hypothetical protein
LPETRELVPCEESIWWCNRWEKQEKVTNKSKSIFNVDYLMELFLQLYKQNNQKK